MQVFYVNIGGGEPTVRRDFWELRRLRDRARRRREVLHQRVRITAARRASASRRATTSTCRSRSTAPRPRSTTRCAARAPTPPRCGRWSTSRGGRARVQDLGRRHARRTRPSSTTSRRSPTATARSCGVTRLRPSGRGVDVWDELHPTAAQQRALYDWLVERGEDVLTGDSFFHLAALRRPAARPEPVRRRPRGLPDRPRRRRLRLPVRHPRRVPGRQRARGRRIRRGVARVRAVPGPAPSADRRRVLVVLALRRLPRRLHGGQVLHRPAPGRARSRMRPGTRRACSLAGRAAAGAAVVGGPLTLRAPARSGLRREPAGRVRPARTREACPCPARRRRGSAAGARRPGCCSVRTRPTWAGPGALGPARRLLRERRRRAAAASSSPRPRRVHPSDWPYERAPLAADCGPGWARDRRGLPAARRPGAGRARPRRGQGSSAYSQSALWAPSRVPDAVAAELPIEMEPERDRRGGRRLRRRGAGRASPPVWTASSSMPGPSRCCASSTPG